MRFVGLLVLSFFFTGCALGQGKHALAIWHLIALQEKLEQLVSDQDITRADGYLVQFSTVLAALGLGVNLATNPNVVQVIYVGNGTGPTQTTIGNTNPASSVSLIGNVSQPLDGVTEAVANYRMFYDVITLDDMGNAIFNANGTDFSIDTILSFSLTYSDNGALASRLVGQIQDGTVGTNNALDIAGDADASVMVMAFCIAA